MLFLLKMRKVNDGNKMFNAQTGHLCILSIAKAKPFALAKNDNYVIQDFKLTHHSYSKLIIDGNDSH